MNALANADGQVSSANPSGNSGRPVDERPIGEIVSNLWMNTETLIRQELQLGLADAEERVHVFKKQIDADVDVLKRELTIKAVAGAVAFAGVLTLTAALVLGLANVMPAWLSALIVGVVITGGAAALLARSVRTPELPNPAELLPKRAAHSVKEDVKTVQEAMK